MTRTFHSRKHVNVPPLPFLVTKEGWLLAANVTQIDSRLMHSGHEGERCKMGLIFQPRCITGHLGTSMTNILLCLLRVSISNLIPLPRHGTSSHTLAFHKILLNVTFMESHLFDLKLASLPACVAQPAATPAAQSTSGAAGIVSLRECKLFIVYM